ncbi:MAG: DEAD/DEAH box helicase [Candidatus Thorarchaeota archaeon]|nr:MAG: DEAD/DEAH box helicase [Candidatus Thorarchaeota archaeon]
MGKIRLEELQINKKIIAHLQTHGISELFEPQEMAFKTGVLSGKNLVLAIPTSSGKTLVAEICMLKAILDGRGKALYLVPLKSLAREKYTEFKKYEELGITTAMSVGDYDSPGRNLKDADIVVVTTERADSLVRHKTEWINNVGIVVADEVHLINDIKRGPTLEMVLAKLMQIVENIQIIALSATISNADQIAEWLKAEMVKSTWRPVPLSEGVYLDGKIDFFQNGRIKSRDIKRERKMELADITCDTLDDHGQVLIFVSSRRSTVAVAKKLASSLRRYITEDAIHLLAKGAKKIASSPSAPEASKTLARLVANGAAFHHAGLDNKERALVEDYFKANLLKVIVATPTLAAGVNLPARRVIIRDYRRFDQDQGSYAIPVLEYKQMAGRAGRPKYDDYGEAVLFARTEPEHDFLIDNYTLSEPEEITSKLASPRAVRSHLLASIASEMTQNREEIDSLIAGTFFSHQNGQLEMDHHISSALGFLESGGLIKTSSSNMFSATPLGKRASRLYIDPYTAILLRDVLTETNKHSTLGFLHLICYTPDQPVTYVTQAETEEYSTLLHNQLNELMVEPPVEEEGPRAYSDFLAQLKTASILHDWISEKTDNNITEQYNVGMGDVHRFVRSAEWLTYAASEIARIVDAPTHIAPLHNLKSRLRYGVRTNILELVSLRGVGRIRGRMLHNHGFTNLADLYKVPIDELARIPTIGSSIAESIKKQLGIDVKTRTRIEEEHQIEDDADSVQTLLEDFGN